MSRTPLVAMVVVASALVGARASACEKLPYDEHVLDSSAHASDTQPPAALEVKSVSLERIARGETKDGSCTDSLAFVRFALPQDDHTDTKDVGVRFDVVTSTGAVPARLLALLDGKTLRTSSGDSTASIAFQFMDDAQLDSFRLEATAKSVDLAGNEGPATTVVIESEGGSGCASASVAGGLWLLLPFVFARRRLR